jgi:two-component system, sensor histidine kinase and response regulator
MTKILIVEDDTSTRENIAEALIYNGYIPLQAENGKEGVEITIAENPDLIVCDINMPIMNGYEMLYHVRNQRETAHIPFIFLTAQTDRTSMRDGMNLGADDYISKPFKQFELLEAIDTRLKKQALTTQHYEDQMKNLRYSIVQALPHELRTPLIGIIGYAELLEVDSASIDSTQVASMARQIAKSGWRLHHVFENYLIYAQIELIAQDPVRRRALSHDHIEYPMGVVGGIIEKVATNYERNIVLLVSQDIPPLAIGAENFTKIMYELLDNACKFSQANTDVAVRMTIRDYQCVINIENDGRGITDEQIRAIGAYMQFERNIYEQQGLGLGLTIAKRMTELHNGSLSINSVKNQRTVVTVALNLAD